MSAAVFTGIGVLAPNGAGTEEFWAATLDGKSAIGRVSRFDPDGYPATLAGQVPPLDERALLPSRLMPQTDYMTRMALIGADWALADSGLDLSTSDTLELGVITASSAGGYEFGQRELQNMWSKGAKYVSAYQSFAWFYAVNTGQISIRNGLRGPGAVVVTEQAGALDAIGKSRRSLRSGTRVSLTGGIDGALCPWGWVAMLAGGRVSTSADPARAYRPFAADATGHVPGEGGAILVLERAESAAGRGARRYGTLAGYAATFDPRPGGDRPPALRRAIELALRDAGVAASDVDVVFADAAGTPELDRVEAEAIGAVFGPGGVPVTAPKSMTGRLMAGAGALDVACALLSIRSGVLPPTIAVDEPSVDYGLDLVCRPRELPVRTALVLGRGHGGHNSAVVVRE